jgi:hypothetical protein
MRLGIESLEDRRILAAYTVQVLDTQNLIPASVENQMRSAGDYVMQNLGRHVSWKGTIDLQLNVQPAHPDHDGVTPAIMQVTPDRRNATIQEMLTGVDPYPTRPDVGMTVFLGKDGTVKLYGMKAYFDPSPQAFVPASVPNGHFDFIGVLNHEVAHGLAFQGTTEFTRYITTVNGYNYFNGPEAVKALGRPIPMSTFGGTHYGNGLLPDNPIKSGLMYQWGNYGGNRLDWGLLDYAVLRDVGLTTKNLAGLPLVDRMDSVAPRIVLSKSNVNENLAAGTTVATISTTLSPAFTYQIVAGADSGSFRVLGNTLVTARSFDFETRSSFSLLVRSIDRVGVWTDTRLTIRVNDVPELPTIVAPMSIAMINGLLNLGSVRVTGDNKSIVVMVESRLAPLTSLINDPSVTVLRSGNNRVGSIITIIGTPLNISRNFQFISYRGQDPSLTIKISAEGVYISQSILIFRPRTV